MFFVAKGFDQFSGAVGQAGIVPLEPAIQPQPFLARLDLGTMQARWTDEVYRIHEVEPGGPPALEAEATKAKAEREAERERLEAEKKKKEEEEKKEDEKKEYGYLQKPSNGSV